MLKHRPLIDLPHGDVWLFGLSNAQIISAFAMNPTTLPGWYWHWIRRTGTLSTEFMDVNRQLGRGTLADMALPRLLLDKTAPFTVPFNETRAQAWLSSPQPLAYPGGPCFLEHPDSAYCEVGIMKKSLAAFRQMAPTYAILHTVPALVFSGKIVVKESARLFASALQLADGPLQSARVRRQDCEKDDLQQPVPFDLCLARPPRHLHLLSHVRSLRDQDQRLVVVRGVGRPDGPRSAVGGPSPEERAGCVPGLAEFQRSPLTPDGTALYCAPKALASVFTVGKQKGYVKSLPYGEMVVACSGMAMLMHCFIHAPDKMSAPVSTASLVSALTVL